MMMLQNYKQIFLKVELKNLVKRDKKNFYKKALKGQIKNVVGVDLKFKRPIKSSLIIENNKNLKNIKPLLKECINKLRIKLV